MKLANIAIFLSLFSIPAVARRNGIGGGRGGNKNKGNGAGTGAGNGAGTGSGGNGNGGGAGTGTNTNLSLDGGEIADLLFMREEEKMARDVYLFLDDLWEDDTSTFATIARSEQRHMDSMLNMIQRYGLTDPVSDESDDGTFQNTTLQAMYDELVENGANSLLDALHVGALIEEVDILDLETAIGDTDETRLDRVYGNLKRASYNHLRRFVGDIVALGYDYEAQRMSQERVDEIINQ